MQKPYLYTVFYRDENGKSNFKETDNEQTALNWEIKYNGTCYIDTRYEAKKRLYWHLWRTTRNESSKEYNE